MNNTDFLIDDLFSDKVSYEPNRKGFGEGLVLAGENDESIVALTADLEESTQVEPFAKAFPDRFVEVGVAEQNLVTLASGLASVGKKPFTTSYASFSPGRNWEQIRTTICLNNQNVKIIGCHAGVSVGPDGATHQMLEDISLMRVLPNMTVVVPCDSIQARKATVLLAATESPGYLRLARESTPVMTKEKSSFEIGKAQVFRTGKDVTIVSCGPVIHEALKAAEKLYHSGIEVEIINSHTIKPLDTELIIKSAKKTKFVLTVEEAQVAGGLGGAVAELIAEQGIAPVHRMGIIDRFGQSGKMSELWKEYSIDSESIYKKIKSVLGED